MANIPRRRSLTTATGRSLTGSGILGPAPSQRFSPFKEMGTSGVAVFGGRVLTRERGQTVVGNQRWITYADLVANTSIVAAGVRYFLNIVAGAKWTVKPAKEKDAEAEKAAEFVDSVINGMVTPWRRVARRAASYRFLGFGIQEWTANRRLIDGKIGLDDIESRPQHTIDRWDVDLRGTVLGVWQQVPQTGEYVYLPRKKLLYLVEDSLTDSPEGLGLYRHLVEPYERLKKYLLLEGQGFERDLRGVPIGRVPYQAIDASVKNGKMTKEQGQKIVQAIEDFVKIQAKSEDTSIVLDSAPYTVQTESGTSISGVMQYGLELLQGQSSDFPGLAAAVERINQEMARIIGVEHLMLGGAGGSANRSLSEDKSNNFYLACNGALDDICDGVNKDVVATICDMNGIRQEIYPKVSHSDISFRSVSEVTKSLADMASAGAVLQPNDPAIDDVRDMLGIKRQPEMTPEMLGAMAQQSPGMHGAAAAATSAGVPPPTPEEKAAAMAEIHAKHNPPKPPPKKKPNGAGAKP